MKRVLIFTLFLLFFFESYAQRNHNGLFLHRENSAFGEVEFWIARIDTFLVTNTTNKTLYILKQMVPRDFELRLPSLGIKPGATAPIEVIYSPRTTGKFKRKLKLYHSGTNQPFYLSFKGEIIGFDEYNQLACPSFSRPNYMKPSFKMSILVLDSLTQKPIKKALLELSKGEGYQQFFTNSDGEMERTSQLGLFFIYSEAKGYYSKEIEHYFNPKRRSITITLVPKEKSIQRLDSVLIELPEISLNDNEKTILEKQNINAISYDRFPENKEENDQFPRSEFCENNVVFLIDVSSSMRGEDRLDLLKKSMIQLTHMLRSIDKVTIMTYSDESQVVLSATSAHHKDEIIKIINGLKAGGSTYGGKAIRQAYKILKNEFITGGNNQIILATDGGFNGLGKGEKQLNRLIKGKANQQMKFSSIGFGKNRRGKDMIENLSKSGEGNYLYISNEDQAKTALNNMIMIQSALKR